MASTLQEILLSTDRRKLVVDDCEHLVDDEVASKSGASGLLVKASYKIVKAVRPDMVNHACDSLLDDFVPRLEPFYAEFLSQGGGSLEQHFTGKAGDIAEALLGVTDQRAEAWSGSALKAAYDKLRPQAKQHVEAAVPNLAKLIQKHADS